MERRNQNPKTINNNKNPNKSITKTPPPPAPNIQKTPSKSGGDKK